MSTEGDPLEDNELVYTPRSFAPGPWYPRPLEGTWEPAPIGEEPWTAPSEDVYRLAGESWYGRTANDVLTGPPAYSVASVGLVPDTSRFAAAVAAATRYEAAPLEVRYAAHLAAKLEELKAREELKRELTPATPWPSIVDAIAEAAAAVRAR